MSPNRRILLNVIATYGRSLYAMVVGLFCGRWTLMALGQTDYGLIGLVGGMTGFVAFFNTLLASAVGRFYAVNVGAANKFGNEEAGLEDCRKWFNTALSIHSVLPVVLIIIGYPVGLWAIEHFLAIPPERVVSCVWVWRFTCLTCFVGMFNVPFQAMYTAKQEIAELTIYSFVSTTCNFGFVYFMVSHPGFWLTRYAAWTCLLSVVPSMIIAVRAVIKYPECRFRRCYLWSLDRLRQLAKYAFAKFWADFSSMFATQGQAIVVNKYMGPSYNASMTVGCTVSGHALSLAGSLSGAFWPAIANKAGEGDNGEMKRLCFLSCRLGAVMVLVFAIPLCLEVHEVLRLWLVNPPDFAAEICMVVLIRTVFEKMTLGYAHAIFGTGNGVMLYSWIGGWAGISTVFVSWLFFALGFGMWSVIIGLSFSKFITVFVRLYLGRTLVDFSFWYWARHVFIPLTLISFVTVVAGIGVRFCLSASLLRVILTTVCCEIGFLPAVWFWGLEASERIAVLKKFGWKR